MKTLTIRIVFLDPRDGDGTEVLSVRSSGPRHGRVVCLRVGRAALGRRAKRRQRNQCHRENTGDEFHDARIIDPDLVEFFESRGCQVERPVPSSSSCRSG